MEKDISKVLNKIIWTCIAGPGGDPDSSPRWAAFYAYECLKKHNFPVESEKEVRDFLSEEGYENLIKLLEK